MLTKKQKWRRLQSRQSRNWDITPSQNQNVTSLSLTSIERKESRITFSQKIQIILIPCRNDYYAANLHTDLWWQPIEYLHFKTEAKSEVSELMKRKNIDIRTAIDLLYQSHPSPSSIIISEECMDSEITSSPSPTGVIDVTFGSTSPVRQIHIHPLEILADLE